MTTAIPDNWLDNRKYKIVGDGKTLIFHMGRKDKKFLELSEDEYLESQFNYPTKDCIHPNQNTMDIAVTYGNDHTLWLADTHQLAKSYPVTLTTFFGRPKSGTIDPEVELWLQQVQIPIEHTIPIGSKLWIKNVKDDITGDRDRIVMVTEHIKEFNTCYPWISKYLPIYKCVHIDTNISLDEISLLTSFPLVTTLANGTKIKKGGQGEVSIDDIEIIIDKPNQHDLKVQLLMIDNFIQRKTILKFQQHAKDTAMATINKIGNRLFRWLSPKFEESDRSEEFFIPKNIKKKEFEFILIKSGIKEWTETNATDTIAIQYQPSMKLFGKQMIVRKFRRKHGTTFILSHINLQFKFNKKRQMLKVETFVKKE